MTKLVLGAIAAAIGCSTFIYLIVAKHYESKTIVSASIAAAFAALAFIGGHVATAIERRISTPSVSVKTSSTASATNVHISTPDANVDEVVISFHIPGHITKVDFPSTAFHGKVRALVTGGSHRGALSNRVDVTFSSIPPDHQLTAIIAYDPVPGVRLVDEGQYEVQYSWWYSGERIVKRYAARVGKDEPATPSGFRNAPVRLTSMGQQWGILNGTDFYKVNGREPNYSVELLAELAEPAAGGLLRTRCGVKLMPKTGRSRSAQTIWSIEWTHTQADLLNRLKDAPELEPRPSIFTNEGTYLPTS